MGVLRSCLSASQCRQEIGLSKAEYDARLDELDRILNDPEVPMEPARVWSLLAEIAGREVPVPGEPGYAFEEQSASQLGPR